MCKCKDCSKCKNRHRLCVKKANICQLCAKNIDAKTLTVDGKPIGKQWVIPISDDFENTPVGSAAVYIGVEEAYNPDKPAGKEKVEYQAWDGWTAFIVSQVGDLVSIRGNAPGSGNNFAWSQENDYSKMYNVAPLVIDFTGTPVEHLIENGGNHTFLSIPGAYGNSSSGSSANSFLSYAGNMQVGNKIIKMWPQSSPDYRGESTLDENGEAFVTTTISLEVVSGHNSISLTVYPGKPPSGQMYVSEMTGGLFPATGGFKIKSTAGSLDEGVNVGYVSKPNYSYAFSKSWAAGLNAFQSFNITFNPTDPVVEGVNNASVDVSSSKFLNHFAKKQ